jgi:hypothetical protein
MLECRHACSINITNGRGIDDVCCHANPDIALPRLGIFPRFCDLRIELRSSDTRAKR